MTGDRKLIEELVSALHLERSTVVIWVDATPLNCTVTMKKPNDIIYMDSWLDWFTLENEELSSVDIDMNYLKSVSYTHLTLPTTPYV